jgi:hypothetical protein
VLADAGTMSLRRDSWRRTRSIDEVLQDHDLSVSTKPRPRDKLSPALHSNRNGSRANTASWCTASSVASHPLSTFTPATSIYSAETYGKSSEDQDERFSESGRLSPNQSLLSAAASTFDGIGLDQASASRRKRRLADLSCSECGYSAKTPSDLK